MRRYFLVILGVFLYTSALLPVCTYGKATSCSYNTIENIPVLYEGRCSPINTYSELWFYDLYQKSRIPSWYHDDFEKLEGDPRALIWDIHFLGHKPFDKTPLFGIKDPELKSLLKLDKSKDHFSYNKITLSLYENSNTNLPLMHRLICHHFYKAYHSSGSIHATERLELTTLNPGIWVKLRGDDIIILSVPRVTPWKFLKPGKQLKVELKNTRKHKSSKNIARAFHKLMQNLHHYENLFSYPSAAESSFQKTYDRLIKKGDPSKKVASLLEHWHSLHKRLKQAGNVLHVLPSNGIFNNDWYSLHALKTKVYNPKTHSLDLVNNFTPYPDTEFEKIRKLYFKLDEAFLSYYRSKNAFLISKKSHNVNTLLHELTALLNKNYNEHLAGTPLSVHDDNAIRYPSSLQLWMGSFYYHFPFHGTTTTLYVIALLLFFSSFALKKASLNYYAFSTIIAAFALHTIILLLRCYILSRPPITNMYETLLYISWVTITVAFILRLFLHSRIILPAANFIAILIFSTLCIAYRSGYYLQDVQHTLNSRSLISPHLFMIVTSYGAFILSSILSHIYLFLYMLRSGSRSGMRFLSRLILQTMFLGIILLVPGSALEGLWTAQSWDIFWNWSHKEFWIFLSSCLYLLIAYSYTFRHIGKFNLALSSIIGLICITLTWCSINFILEPGIYYKSFGNIEESLYYLYFSAESFFIAHALFSKRRISVRSRVH